MKLKKLCTCVAVGISMFCTGSCNCMAWKNKAIGRAYRWTFGARVEEVEELKLIVAQLNQNHQIPLHTGVGSLEEMQNYLECNFTNFIEDLNQNADAVIMTKHVPINMEVFKKLQNAIDNTTLDMNYLVLVAEATWKIADLPPINRIQRRCMGNMLQWFDDNWPAIEPHLRGLNFIFSSVKECNPDLFNVLVQANRARYPLVISNPANVVRGLKSQPFLLRAVLNFFRQAPCGQDRLILELILKGAEIDVPEPIPVNPPVPQFDIPEPIPVDLPVPQLDMPEEQASVVKRRKPKRSKPRVLQPFEEKEEKELSVRYLIMESIDTSIYPVFELEGLLK